MMGHGAKVQSKRDAAILALLELGNIAQAATKAGIGEATLGRWLKQESFQREYRTARQHVFQIGLSKLAHLTGKAVQTLEMVMNDPLAKGSVKVSAARTTLEISVRLIEIEDFESRLLFLEQAAREAQHAA